MKSKIVKSVILSTVIATLSAATLPSISQAASSGVFENSSVSAENVMSSNDSVKYYAGLLEEFVEINEKDGTIFLNNSYKSKVQVPKDVIDSINAWLKIMNKDIKSGFYC